MGLLEQIPPEVQENLNRIWTSPKKRAASMAVFIMITLVLVYGTIRPSSSASSILPLDSQRSNVDSIRRSDWSLTSDYDIVVSHYNEDVNMMRETIESVKSRLPHSSSNRVIIYHKGQRDKQGLEELLDMSDEVVQLENLGREGETYLSHIVRHYDTSVTNLAEHTIFMQPHLAWHWVFLPRLERVLQPDTGFLSFGPYLSHTCGNDSTGQVFPRMADIYSMFRMDLCPPEPVLATWAGQFLVSRTRILENPRRAYANLREKFHVDKDHWIYKEGWWDNEPSNPTLGHALERSWPMIFNCTDATRADTCDEEEGHGASCQCLDE
ncbi:hypothetical protein L486_05311 [Kwoniella mangroviensis CBS 10435]|uniref:Uncharacterized protein n=1 Tax=Kwoniella mangroviensis CBS 10435 TaxID=1331196 RepID=A0A1B9IQL2_9TREE|nr:uncharacterized protein I203_08420 [Kwoniella mangroviensis CBS 8507]OCF57846.1 hypothetical protein L486_05311 [Kwoniella mangroviensis CBS 10435]OCF62496.1 hypothetical protein I203_08420 [Kwoniella mangroviensis CBS 8507]